MTLARRIAAAKPPGVPPEALGRTRKVLGAMIRAAEGAAPAVLRRDLALGRAAVRVGGADLERQAAEGVFAGAACRAGCAFCCIVGPEGPPVTHAEAEALHGALAPRAGAAPGTDWHPRACPALDPATRGCRAYAARPLICRSYTSRDAGACEANAAGGRAAGAGVAGAQVGYLAAHAVARAALRGEAKVPTYALARVAGAAIRGAPLARALADARQAPRALVDELRRLS